jgi:16S rRNA (cytosine967-C5)-methyltransferase
VTWAGRSRPAYGRVLVDAPCTGLGALRRRPEARWRRQPSDVAELAPLQRALLTSALAAVAPGGVVAYATCSPHVAETRFVVSDVLKKHPDVEVVDARPLFTDASGAPVDGLGDGPYVQLWPHVHGTDAMFFALLRRR